MSTKTRFEKEVKGNSEMAYSFVAYSCYLSSNSNDTHIAAFILPLVRGKYLYSDATFCIQKCTRTSKISIYPSKRQKHSVSTTNCGKFQMLYRKGQKASIEISMYPVTENDIIKKNAFT